MPYVGGAPRVAPRPYQPVRQFEWETPPRDAPGNPDKVQVPTFSYVHEYNGFA
jgi:hypothetical protein